MGGPTSEPEQLLRRTVEAIVRALSDLLSRQRAAYRRFDSNCPDERLPARFDTVDIVQEELSAHDYDPVAPSFEPRKRECATYGVQLDLLLKVLASSVDAEVLR